MLQDIAMYIKTPDGTIIERRASQYKFVAGEFHELFSEYFINGEPVSEEEAERAIRDYEADLPTEDKC